MCARSQHQHTLQHDLRECFGPCLRCKMCMPSGVWRCRLDNSFRLTCVGISLQAQRCRRGRRPSAGGLLCTGAMTRRFMRPRLWASTPPQGVTRWSMMMVSTQTRSLHGAWSWQRLDLRAPLLSAWLWVVPLNLMAATATATATFLGPSRKSSIPLQGLASCHGK